MKITLSKLCLQAWKLANNPLWPLQSSTRVFPIPNFFFFYYQKRQQNKINFFLFDIATNHFYLSLKLAYLYQRTISFPYFKINRENEILKKKLIKTSTSSFQNNIQIKNTLAQICTVTHVKLKPYLKPTPYAYVQKFSVGEVVKYCNFLIEKK